MEELAELNQKWRHWHYKNTGFLILSLIAFFFLADTPVVKQAFDTIGNLGYVGAFIAGLLYVSIFTAVPASVVLFYLADNLDPVGIALAAGLGGVLGDYMILKYLKDQVFDELKPLYMKHGGRAVKRLFGTPYFVWLVPIVGATLIASPVPDEVGITMLGLSKIKTWQFLIVTFLLDVASIFLIIMAAKLF